MTYRTSAEVTEVAAQFLDEIADGFETGRIGWLKGSAERYDGYRYSNCLLGALYRQAESDDRPRYQAVAAVRGVLWDEKKSDPGYPRSIAGFNDDPRTQLNDVIDVVRRAAKELRNKI